jgi:hypothetical protein
MSSIDTPAGATNSLAQAVAEDQSVAGEWAETALTVLFTATALLFMSFIAVVTGLV